MKDWPRFVDRWEAEVLESLRMLQPEDMAEAELHVLASGLRLPAAQVGVEEARLWLEASGLAPEDDYVEFLANVGSIHLLAMGAATAFSLAPISLSCSPFESPRYSQL